MEKMEAKIFTQNSRIAWIIPILLLAAFLRLYKIADYMTFLGDEGRDVLIVKHLLEGDLVGLGPTASVGGFFTGPIYYYFMAPFLWFFKLNPVGPAVMVALFGVATVFLVYWAGRELFSHKAGLVASSLYAVSPIVIAYSRSSWNPNPLPFFSILTILFVFKSTQKKSLKYLFLAGVSLGIALQLHYIASFLMVAVGFYLLLTNFPRWTTLARHYFTIFIGFLVGYFPFLAFEATHGFPNTITVVKFILGTTGETGFVGERFNIILGDVFFRLFGRLLMRFPPPEQINLGKDAITVSLYGPSIDIPLSIIHIFIILLALVSIFLIIRQYKKYSLLLVWFTVGLVLFGFYKKPIYDYYFAFMFPLPFLLVGNLLVSLKNYGKIIGGVLFIALLLLNLDGMPFRHNPNRQLEQVKQISEFVLERAENKPFNFALITGQNSDHAYRYFFEVLGNPPKQIENELNDPQRKTVTDQLLIICEDRYCQPLGHPLWEVAGFGRGEIAGEWTVSVVKVYKLIHYKGE